MKNELKARMKDKPGVRGRAKFTVRNEDGSIAQECVYDNLVVDAGLAALAYHLVAGSPTPSTLRINNVALGSGTTAPAATDTTLETEVYRNNTASANHVANVATVTGYFGFTETSGTYREAGLFIAGDGSTDSGTLFSRIAINITKTTIQTLTVEWEITFTAA